MPTRQGDPALLDDPVASRLLRSAIPVRLAYAWADGEEIVPERFPSAPEATAPRDGGRTMDGRQQDGAAAVAGRSRRAVLRGVAGGGVAAAFAAAGWAVEGAHAQEATPPAGPAAEPNAIVVLFGQPTDPAAFEAYYAGTHRPLALRIPGLVEILGGPLLGTLEGGAPEHHRIAVLRFPDRAALETALASPEGQEAFADVANFATGGATAHLARLEAAAAAGGAATPAA